MGARYSMPSGNGSEVVKPQTMNNSFEAKKQQILSFHSSAKWKAHFEASKSTKKLMVIDFTASWCGPCRFMEPFIEDWAAKYIDVEFIKIDVDELMDVAREYGVQMMPTFILMKGGNVIDKVTGGKRVELQTKIEKHRVSNFY